MERTARTLGFSSVDSLRHIYFRHRCGFSMPHTKKISGERANSDVILPMQDPYMTQITDGKKNYEFRK